MKAGIVIKGVITLIIALAAAEGFLRTIIAPELIYETWFNPGVHTPDREFGFVFTPGFRGFMRHRDGVPNVPLQLDERGFRMPAVSVHTDRAPRSVVFIGGASMMMCYGLTDQQTIGAQLADASSFQLTVQDTALPGFDLHRNYHLWRRAADAANMPDLAVVCVYGTNPATYARMPEDLNNLPDPPPTDELFRFDDGLVLSPGGTLANALGPAFYDSYLLHVTTRSADRILRQFRKLAPDEEDADLATTSQRGLERFADLLSYLHEQLTADGVKMLVVFIPDRGETPEHYDRMTAAVPPQVRWVDLHKQMIAEIEKTAFIANGHYSPTHAALIGKRLAALVDPLLAE